MGEPFPDRYVHRYLDTFIDCEVVQHKVLEVDECMFVPRSLIMFEIMRQGTAVKFWIGEQDEENPLHIWVDNEPISIDYFSTWFLTVKKQQIFVEEFYVSELDVVVHRSISAMWHKVWNGHFRLNLDWGGRTVVIGDMITDQVSSNLPEVEERIRLMYPKFHSFP
ncbi:hypothetical protein MPTK1_6g18310 [Marchantia polymorpha subsp. ruderalis]|uniref:Uncharacterized protein n=2 Tax=Marchantia polymorpha TaxID=3197 RepID=A0AAF6BTB9_MARPO|nr:hypothetical protein MARPO_0038s0041 [Marchantia polymorpha]BBN15253.1 hypothetical protein Mp_6g18310 [Marchantia polymorpha subsp. ruderalis]|eukprot:PTQ40686.1 hypothetical protein MARPO_0038s0041 [Marchantia polymorpha]